METGIVDSKKIWVPDTSFGVCIWIMPDGLPLTDGDGVLSAEGIINDPKIEKRVAEAALYWTGSDAGHAAWVSGARKVSKSEFEDQSARLSDGLVPDPYEDVLKRHFGV